MSNNNLPYEYYDNKLGFKIKFIISDDKKCHESSIRLIKYRSLSHRMNSKTCCEKQLRRASLGSDALVEFDSLTKEWRELITLSFGKPKRKIEKSYFEKHYTYDDKAFNFFCAYRFGDNNERKLDPEVIRLYTRNVSVINTAIEVKNNRRAYAKALGGIKMNIWETLSRDINAFTDVKHDLPTTPTSLRHKVTKFQKEGYLSIISKKYGTRNASKIKEKEQIALLDELLSKHTNLDNQIIATLYNTIAKKFEWNTITANTVANRKEIKDLVTTAGRKGVKSLANNKLMQVKRQKPSSSMLYWTLDGWDVELLYQKTEVDSKGNTRTTYHNRLTTVLVLDPYNKYPIGYAIGTHETPSLIQKALQNAINHTKQLFGEFYKPYQLQSDNYSIKKLRPLYEGLTKHFTPASVGNAKAKVIEPYFGFINKKYFKLYDNWSGHNVDSGSKNQPNSEYLNKIRHQFPDETGCRNQIHTVIQMERAAKRGAFLESWQTMNSKYKLPMNYQSYMLLFGSRTGNTNKLTGEGIRIKIDGANRFYDCFDVNFRNHAKENWQVIYDTNDLSRALAVSKDEKLIFELEEKIQPAMCIADQTEEGVAYRKRVNQFNKSVVNGIIAERSNNYEVLTQFFAENPSLNDTMAKHLLVDSSGQHKIHKNKQRKIAESGKIIEIKETKKAAKEAEKTFTQQQQEYYNSKIDVNKYL